MHIWIVLRVYITTARKGLADNKEPYNFFLAYNPSNSLVTAYSEQHNYIELYKKKRLLVFFFQTTL